MTDSQHLVMLVEDGRSVVRRVSTAEYAELKAVRSGGPTATAAPAKADGAPAGLVRAVMGYHGL